MKIIKITVFNYPTYKDYFVKVASKKDEETLKEFIESAIHAYEDWCVNGE